MSLRINHSFKASGLDSPRPQSARPTKSPPFRGGLVDAVLFGLFVYDGFSFPGLPIAIPVSELAAICLVLTSLLRRPIRSVPTANWLLPVFGLLLIFLVVCSIANDVDWFRRAFRIASLVSLLWVISCGRANVKAGLTGIAVALVANAVLFYAGVAPDNYQGVLTGYLGDKNVAGLYYVIFPLLIAATSSSRRLRWLSIAVGLVGAFLTESRTSLGAFAAALVWVLVSPKLPRPGRVALGVLLIGGLQYVEANLARTWIFSDREGSDILRERIELAALEKTESAPWYGLGLGESYVEMDGRRWFYHDSYLGLIVEGGFLFLVVVAGAYVMCGLRPFTRRHRTIEVVYVEAATIALLVCAWKLGEVFLSIPGFILLGYALKLYMTARFRTAQRN